MKKTRFWTIAITASALAVGGLLSAAPAQSAGTLTVGTGSITATLDAGEALYFCDTSVSAASCNGTNNVYSGLASGTYTRGSSVNRRTPFGSTTLPEGTYNVSIVDNLNNLVTSETNVLIGSGSGGGSSDAAPSAPVEVSLSLDLAASGASCKEGSAAAGIMGAWMYLPAADDCSSTTNPDAKLLGWSTSANFPVDRAQSQVDNRWGAIDEVFDGVRMIFIPAGQATFVSGPNSLHPIWAS